VILRGRRLIALLGCVSSCATAPASIPHSEADPPAILTGAGELECTMSAKGPGRQMVRLRSGSGVEFDATVSAMIDGTAILKGPQQGGSYRFTAHLDHPVPAKLSGVGEVTLEELETKVSVELKRYQQEGGPGAVLSFTSTDMAERDIYVEFLGRARSRTGEGYKFRVNLGPPTEGSGRVEPASANEAPRMEAKSVQFVAPLTTVLIKTEVARAP
jgi:hypothetical protein